MHTYLIGNMFESYLRVGLFGFGFGFVFFFLNKLNGNSHYL